MAKVKWFEEQKVAKQTAVDNAVKLTESEWQSKLETALEIEVDKRVEEAKSQWTKERQSSFDKELQTKLAKEKENIKIVMESEFEKTLEKVKEEIENEKESEKRKAVDNERVRATNRAELDKEVLLQKEEEKWMSKMEKDLEIRLAREKRDWEENNEIDVLQKIHEEKLKWNRKKDIEMKEMLEEERKKWQNSMEKQEREKEELEKLTVEQRELHQKKELKQAIEHARREWEDSHEYSVEQIRNSMEEQIQERISAEVSIALDQARKEWLQEKQKERSASEELSLSVIKEEIETLKEENSDLIDKLKQKEEQWKTEKEEVFKQNGVEFKKKLEQEIAELQDQQDKFVKENHETLTETLKQAREKFSKEVNELKKGHEEEIQKYKERLHKEDDLSNDSFRRNMEGQKTQWEEEKNRLEQEVQERDALLEKADSHLSQEIEKMTVEMEKAYQTKLETEINTARQKFEHEASKLKLPEPGTEKLKKRLKDLEEENKMVLSKYEMLKSDTEKFRSEVDKVVRENQKVKFENQKVLLDIQKAKADTVRLKEEYQRVTEENKNQKNELESLKEENRLVKASLEEVSENSSKVTENYKKSVEELNEKLRGQEDQVKELDSLKLEVETLRHTSEKIKQEQEAVEEQRRNQGEKYNRCRNELQNIIQEKEKLVDNIRNLESAYKKDLAAQKHKQDEVNEKLRKTEKAYHETKRYYRNEMEKIKKSLETENTVAMDTMKSKMVEMQHGHKKTLDNMKRQFQTEYQRMDKEMKDLRERSLNSTEVQTDSEDVDEESVMQIRGQYLDTVTKIKEDVLKHITETNMRAAETVRCEMVKERNATLKQLKRIYMDNVKKVLQNEIIGANIESKLSDIEQALELISVNSSRSQTPADDLSRTNTPTPRSSSVTGSCERFPVGTSYKLSDINIDEEKDDSFKFKPNILSNVKANDLSPAEANITLRERHSRETTLGNKSPRELTCQSPRELTRQSPRDVLYNVQDKLSRSSLALESDNTQSDKESYEKRPVSSSSSSRRSRHEEASSLSSSRRSRHEEASSSSSSRRSRHEEASSSSSSHMSRQEEDPRHEKLDKKSTKTESVTSNRKTAKNVHFTPTKDLRKRSENREQLRKDELQNFDSIHSRDPISRKYLLPFEAENITEDKFGAVDPRPLRNNRQRSEVDPPFHTNRTPRDFLSPRETTPSIGHQQSSLYKARSQPELGFGFNEPFSLRESGLGSYKYTSLRDALGKTPNSTSPPKNSSISQEDLRSYPVDNTSFRYQKALSVDIGLHNLGLERSPRKFNPSPEKLTHDAGESPMGTPRIRRKIAPSNAEREDKLSSQERISRDFNRYHGGPKPVRNLVEQFSGVV